MLRIKRRESNDSVCVYGTVRRIFVYFIGGTLAVLFLAGTLLGEEKNLLLKTNFDTGFEGWGHWQRTEASFKWDEVTGHNNPGSLMVDTKGSNKTHICFLINIKIEKEKDYHASVWCKTEDVSPGTTIELTANWKDKDKNWLSNKYPLFSIPLNNPERTDWRQIDLYFKSPEAPELYYLVYSLKVKNSSKGKIWFDEAYLAEMN